MATTTIGKDRKEIIISSKISKTAKRDAHSKSFTFDKIISYSNRNWISNLWMI